LFFEIEDQRAVGFSLSVVEVHWDQKILAVDKRSFVIVNVKEKRRHATQEVNVVNSTTSRAATTQSSHACSLFIGR
jgi:hypothetical protein